jgi:hypothetical protein
MIDDAIAPPKLLLYFSPVAWDSYAQRPHHFARHFLARGGDAVLWVDPYPNRLPGLGDLKRRRAHPVAVEPEPRVRVLDVPAWPVEPLPGGVALNRTLRWRGLLARLERETDGALLTIGVGRPSALAVLALDRLRARARFYDAMDDFPEFYSGLSRRSMRRREDEVAARVDRVYAASDPLVAKFAARGLAAVPLPNAYAMRTLPPFAPRPRGAPVVFGYVGTVGRWFDWGIVAALPRAFPLAEVRIVGPVFAKTPWLPANVRLLGACAQPEAVAHLRDFSCGLIPFRKTPLTAAVDPIKFYEYRAMGLPILSTRFGQMKARGRRDGVFSLEDGIEAPARAALAHVVDPADVARFRARNDWEARLGGVAYPELASLPAEGVPV